jgi:hypothetical protein
MEGEGWGRGGCIRQPEMKTEVTMPKTRFVLEKNRLIGYICMSITHIGIRKEQPTVPLFLFLLYSVQ